MAALNMSLSFFFVTVALCWAARRASKALLSAGAYTSFAREAAGVAQSRSCCLEMQMLAEIGPWAGGFSPDLLLTLLFLAHGVTFDGASANPTMSLQELLLAEASLPSTLLKLVAQGLGMQAACARTQLYWAWELSDLQVLQSLLDTHCSSALHTAVLHGALLEGACTFLFHLTLLRLRSSLPMYRVPAGALLVTITAYTGMGLAVLLYQGHLPRLFQWNLLYSQRNKYGTPRGKLAPGPGDTQTVEGYRGREPGWSRVGPS